MQKAADELSKRFDNARKNDKKDLSATMKAKMSTGGKHFYRFLRNDYRSAAVTLWDAEANSPTTFLPRVHTLFENTWKPIFNMHKDKRPCYATFKNLYQRFYPNAGPAPTGPLSDEELFQSAQRVEPDSAPGMDGWKSIELRHLP